MVDDVWMVFGGDDGINFCLVGDVCGLQFGVYVVGVKFGDVIVGDGVQCVVDVVNVFNQFCLWVVVWVGGEQVWLVG